MARVTNGKKFCDMTLSCDKRQIKTHKLIISFCSSVLRNILKLNQTQHPVIGVYLGEQQCSFKQYIYILK